MHGKEISDNFGKYLHDVKNPLTLIKGYADLIIKENITGPESFDMLRVIQSSIQMAVSINSAFDMRQDVMLNRPYLLGKSMNLIQGLSRVYKEPISDPEGTSASRLKVNVTFDTFLTDPRIFYELSHFNPLMVERLISNFIQNAFKAYRSLAAETGTEAPEGSLSIHISYKDGQIAIQADDEATGFPEKEASERLLAFSVRQTMTAESSSPVIYSKLDRTELDPHEVRPGQTKWGKNVKGTGVGLANLVADIQAVRGKVVMGTKIKDGKRQGARIEVYFPCDLDKFLSKE